MKLRIIYLLMLFSYFRVDGQNVLSGVYVSSPLILGKDTLYSFLQGRAIDSLTHKSIANVKVELSSSRGDAINAKTDSSGNFKIKALPSNCEIRIIFVPDSKYNLKEWYFNTNGIDQPIQLKTIFKLTPK